VEVVCVARMVEALFVVVTPVAELHALVGEPVEVWWSAPSGDGPGEVSIGPADGTLSSGCVLEELEHRSAGVLVRLSLEPAVTLNGFGPYRGLGWDERREKVLEVRV
jgi:hypothetical protein